MFKGLKKLLGLIVIVFLIYTAYQIFFSFFPVKYQDYIEMYAEDNNIEKNLVYGIINAESGFDTNAISPKGAVGLMQLKKDTAKWCAQKMGEPFDETKLIDAQTNIKIGTWYFAYLKNELGTENLAIIAYNAGITHAKEWLKEGIIDDNVSNPDNIPFEETKKYIRKVKVYTKIYSFIEKIQEIQSAVKEFTGGNYEKF
ncbi:MAG: lytic transglycosylase domain-containing protein [Clostridia bacterium]|nr:lytic transglycosylase domain-containing protein [Clostridia bacterium]